MINFLKELLSGLDSLDKRVTFGIALAGFVMSLISWLKAMWLSRKRLVAEVAALDEYCTANYSSKYLNLVIPVSLINKSSSPISVARIDLFNIRKHSCKLTPSFLGEKFNNAPTLNGHPPYLKYIESAAFPINLVPMQGILEYIHFELPLDFEYTVDPLFIARTSRGRSIVFSKHLKNVHELLKKAIQERVS